jgi:hypothetical protein
MVAVMARRGLDWCLNVLILLGRSQIQTKSLSGLDGISRYSAMMWSTSDAIPVRPCRCGGVDHCCSPLSSDITT